MVWPGKWPFWTALPKPGVPRHTHPSTHPTHTPTRTHITSNGGPLAGLKRHIFHFQPPSPCLRLSPHFTTTLPLWTVCLLLPPTPPTHPHHIISLCLLNSVAFKGDAFSPPKLLSFMLFIHAAFAQPLLILFSLSAFSSIPIPSSPSLFDPSSSPLSFLLSSSSLGLQLPTLGADTAHQPTSRPHYWHTCVHVHVCMCVPGAVVTVGPHRVWAVAYCDIL